MSNLLVVEYMDILNFAISDQKMDSIPQCPLESPWFRLSLSYSLLFLELAQVVPEQKKNYIQRNKITLTQNFQKIFNMSDTVMPFSSYKLNQINYNKLCCIKKYIIHLESNFNLSIHVTQLNNLPLLPYFLLPFSFVFSLSFLPVNR